MEDLRLIDNTHFRLIYSFFISDEIKSFNDHISYVIALICLKECFRNRHIFDDAIFIIQASNKNNPLIKELECKLIEWTLHIKNVSFIIEENDTYKREGGIFKKYIIDKLGDYDGLTLFFHNKGLNKVYGNTIDEWCSYWIIGEYYYLMTATKDWFGGFLRTNKLIYGWPYMHDNFHKQWLIGGNCFWMKCQEIKKYIEENNLTNNYITSKCISEFYFPEILNNNLIEYYNSGIIKEYFDYVDYYEPSMNDKFNIYLKDHSTYSDYSNFKLFYDMIIRKYYNYINK